LLGQRKIPVLLSAIGDAFLQDEADGTVHLLSAGDGETRLVAASASEFQVLLKDHGFVSDNFVPSLVVELRSAGNLLGPGQLYGYKVPPCLGGEYSIDNLEPTDIEVHFSLLGQIHKKVRTLPPGTPIGMVELK
jgi:hypothetical protein